MDSKDKLNEINKIVKEYKKQDPELLFLTSIIFEQESNIKPRIYIIQNCEYINYKYWYNVKVQLPSNKVLFPILVNDEEIKPLNQNNEYSKLCESDKQAVIEAMEYIKHNIDLILHYCKGDFEEFELHHILAGRTTLENILSKKGK